MSDIAREFEITLEKVRTSIRAYETVRQKIWDKGFCHEDDLRAFLSALSGSEDAEIKKPPAETAEG